jgi:hypothetical protein
VKKLGQDATQLPPSGQQLNTDIQNVQSSWQALNSAASKDFPTETKNLQGSGQLLAASTQKLQSGQGTGQQAAGRGHRADDRRPARRPQQRLERLPAGHRLQVQLSGRR